MSNRNNPTPPWSDESREQSDIVGRHEFTRVVANRVDSCVDGQGSTVFGLVGPWGSGKTTLLKDVVGQLGKNWTTVWFSPWSVADVGSITAEFVSALSEAFPQATSLKKKLTTYSRFGAPMLKMIPVVGGTASALATDVISEMTKRPAWHSEFGTLSDDIAAQHKRVLVIVDDVDRLDGDELRSLLRVVRLLGRFTNVHYLLAYDQATVDGVLNATGMSGESSEFMEKIVQYPFEVPPVPTVVRRRWSRAILDAVSPVGEVSGAEHVEDREDLVRILALGLETPRAAERLKEQMLSLNSLLAEAEVDALDFTALTWLRIAHHQVWDHIRLNSLDYLSWREGDAGETQTKRMECIESLVTRGHARPVQEAVTYLFKPAGLGAGFSGRQGRMRLSRYFDRYFQVGLADDDVSERRTQNALRLLDSDVVGSQDAEELKQILLGSDGERSSLALETVINFRRHRQETSLSVLDFAEYVRTELNAMGKTQLFRSSSAEHWLAQEIFLALKTRLLSTEEVIARFGYSTLVASGYAAQRSRRYDASEIKSLYTGIVESWVSEVRNESLPSTLARPELIHMTSFCIWITDVKDHSGFLSERVTSALTLVDAATAFISFNEWVGAGVSYDITFREEEFRFAVGNVARPYALSEIPPVAEVSDYEVTDRKDRELTDGQRRDFAAQSLHARGFF